MKYPIKVQPPGGDCIFVVLRVEEARGCVSFARLDDIHLDLGHSAMIEKLVGEYAHS